MSKSKRSANLRKTIKDWSDHIGYKKAVARLVAEEVSTRAAERLCAGEYPSEPKSLREKIFKAMSREASAVRAAKSA